MDALIRWLDIGHGRRNQMANKLGITRSALSQILARGYLPAKHIEPVREITEIPLKYLVRKQGAGLSEQELAELDIIARRQELATQEEKTKTERDALAELRGKKKSKRRGKKVKA